jgi:Flp pilus assembly protein TadB
VEVRLYGRPLRVGLDGTPGLPEAQADIERAAEVGTTGELIGAGVAAAGVAVMVLTIVAGLPGLAVLGGVIVIVGAGFWWKLRHGRLTSRRQAENDKERLAHQARTITEALQNCHTVHTNLRKTVEADRQAIVTVLT